MPTIHVNDFDMHYEIRGEGEPLLLLHGGTGIGADWAHVFPIDPPGYRIVVPDLRGHGRSTNPSRQFTFTQCAEDVVALLDALQIDRAKAIGMSMGAKTLLHVATAHPDRLSAMVLVSATPYFPQPMRAIAATFDARTLSEDDWAALRQRHVHGDDQIRALWEMTRGFATSYDDMAFTPPLLATIRARTLVVHGDRDPLYPLELAVEIYRSIPNAALWVVPNGAHGPIFGAMAPRFVETALAFLQS
jgi:pimeloyl-ACP methyl ester carboxylesterase